MSGDEIVVFLAVIGAGVGALLLPLLIQDRRQARELINLAIDLGWTNVKASTGVSLEQWCGLWKGSSVKFARRTVFQPDGVQISTTLSCHDVPRVIIEANGNEPDWLRSFRERNFPPRMTTTDEEINNRFVIYASVPEIAQALVNDRKTVSLLESVVGNRGDYLRLADDALEVRSMPAYSDRGTIESVIRLEWDLALRVLDRIELAKRFRATSAR